MVGALLQRASSQMDGTQQLDCVNGIVDCVVKMAIEDWPQESRPACSRKGWAEELLQQNLDVVHSRTVRVGSPPIDGGTHNSCWEPERCSPPTQED